MEWFVGPRCVIVTVILTIVIVIVNVLFKHYLSSEVYGPIGILVSVSTKGMEIMIFGLSF